MDEDTTPSEAVVTAVAKAEVRKPSDGPPLYEAVNPDALDAFFQTCQSGRVEFEYAEYVLVAKTDGAVIVRETKGED